MLIDVLRLRIRKARERSAQDDTSNKVKSGES